MSSKNKKIASMQSHTYASAYVIISPTSTRSELSYVMGDGRTTCWANQALYDSARDAIAVALALGITCANVVRIHLSCSIERLQKMECLQTIETIAL